ncbi:MAG: transposase family protein [Pseudonocardia sp.]
MWTRARCVDRSGTGGGGAEDVAGLVERFAGVADPRSRRGVRYSLATILALCAAASLSGCTSTVEITTWVARAEQDLLAALGCRRDGAGRCIGPHPDTVDRVRGLLDAQAPATA